MSELGDRHQGTAGGHLTPAEEASPLAVHVVVSPDVADRVDTQLALLMLCNLLSRSADFVSVVTLNLPDVARAIGTAPPGFGLPPRLPAAAQHLFRRVGTDAVPARLDAAAAAGSLTLTLGPGPSAAPGWRVHGNRWRGVATKRNVRDDTDNALPFGPYAAAALACGVVCLTARGVDWAQSHQAFDAWDLTSGGDAAADTRSGGPSSVAGADVTHLLAGAGAVGNAHLLTLATTPGLTGTVDVYDDDVVDTTNRNRCVLFFEDNVDVSKATVVDGVLAGCAVAVRGHNGRAEEAIVAASSVVSAVDTPESRQAVQARYPRRLTQASTKNLRVEILRCDPTHATACLRCYQTPTRRSVSDDDLRRELAKLPVDELARQAQELGGAPEDLKEWIDTGRCSAVAGEMLTRFRIAPGETEFSVGFVSLLAGVLLAAQTVKEALPDEPGTRPPLHAATSRGRFTLLDMDAATNGAGPYGRDAACPMCRPGTPAANAWTARYRA